jgi:thiol-disulfide isomerase/thioredoxin
MAAWSEVFAGALEYSSFLDRYASAAQRQRWDAMHALFSLNAEQSSRLAPFSRRMPVLCLAGAWCGDCVNHCPVFDQFATAQPKIEFRFLDRDARPEIRSLLSINGGQRVPVLVFLSEDWFEVFRYGDRPLSTYRQMAAQESGAACPTGLFAPTAETLAAIATEWLNEFERAQLILRLSPRLRARYGD